MTDDILEDMSPFTVEELKDATAKIKTGKAPAPDHLTPEAVKILVEVSPLTVVRVVFNHLLAKQTFSTL